MRGELGVDRAPLGQHAAGAGDVADVGVGLAGEDGELGETRFLGAFDFAVPVGALDQADHQAAVGAAAEIGEVVDDGGGAAAVGLDDEAESFVVLDGGV